MKVSQESWVLKRKSRSLKRKYVYRKLKQNVGRERIHLDIRGNQALTYWIPSLRSHLGRVMWTSYPMSKGQTYLWSLC